MTSRKLVASAWVSLTLALHLGCATGLQRSVPSSAAQADLVILQMNDVYELTPVANGKLGGMARVAKLTRELEKKNPNTLVMLAGDFLSPSALSAARIDDKPLAGRQMVDVFNLAGLDFVTIGNHEIDLKEEDLTKRIEESKFTWISSNVLRANGERFNGVHEFKIVSIPGRNGKALKLGLFGVTLAATKKPYVKYLDPIATAREQVKKLRGEVDILVALTHLDLADDQRLAKEVPGIDLIMGGHEHFRIFVPGTESTPPVTKADANAVSVFVHTIQMDPTTHKVGVESHSAQIDSDISSDPEVEKSVQGWVDRAEAAFRSAGFDPEKNVARIPHEIEAFDSKVRHERTEITDSVGETLRKEFQNAEFSFFNAGTLRIDDIIPEGNLTEYDVLRMFPFGDKIHELKLKGDVVIRLLNLGKAKIDTGEFMQVSPNVTQAKDGSWMIDDRPVDPNRTYTAVTIEYPVSGKSPDLAFIKKETFAPGALREGRDFRRAFIDYMKQRY